MQPIVLDDQDIARFKQNEIVRLLLDKYPGDLNDICMLVYDGKFSNEDYTQLMQLIGYSVSGYGELDTSPRILVRRVDKKVNNLISQIESNNEK